MPGLGGSLENEMAAHTNILAWKIPTHKELDKTERLTHLKEKQVDKGDERGAQGHGYSMV